MEDGAHLRLGHIRGDDEGPETEFGQKVLHTVGLGHVFDHDYCFAL